jgi:hypothetical protein
MTITRTIALAEARAIARAQAQAFNEIAELLLHDNTSENDCEYLYNTIIGIFASIKLMVNKHPVGSSIRIDLDHFFSTALNKSIME